MIQKMITEPSWGGARIKVLSLPEMYINKMLILKSPMKVGAEL